MSEHPNAFTNVKPVIGDSVFLIDKTHPKDHITLVVSTFDTVAFLTVEARKECLDNESLVGVGMLKDLQARHNNTTTAKQHTAKGVFLSPLLQLIPRSAIKLKRITNRIKRGERRENWWQNILNVQYIHPSKRTCQPFPLHGSLPDARQ